MGLSDRPEAGLAARTGVRRQDRSLAALGRISLASQRNLLRVLRFHRILSRKPVSLFGNPAQPARRTLRSAGAPDALSSANSSASFERARLRRLLIVPIPTSQMTAASS